MQLLLFINIIIIITVQYCNLAFKLDKRLIQIAKMNEDNLKREIKPVAAGCVIKSTDTEHIISSFACFTAFIVYGACNASLGAAVPMISTTVHRNESLVGFAFITRGCGFLIATLVSGFYISMYPNAFPKDYLVCIFAVTMGFATLFIGYNSNYQYFLLLTIIQGIGYGVVDTLANCLLPDLWGIRVQPWMQALHLCFGIGAIIGPALIGTIGMHFSYIFIGILSIIPLSCLLLSNFVKQDFNLNDTKEEEDITTIDISTSTDTDAIYEENIGIDKDINNVDNSNLEKDDETNPVPFWLRILIVLFYFAYAGTEATFGGWISVYAMETKVTDDPSNAAYIATAFWLALTIGRISGVFTAIYFSATVMLRFHLVFTLISTLLVLAISSISFNSCLAVSICMGLGVSAIYPLAMTVVSDYGYTMDSTSTTMFMLGAVFGEAGLPMIMGLVIEFYGPIGFLYGILLAAISIILIYIGIHMIGSSPVNNNSSIELVAYKPIVTNNSSLADEPSCRNDMEVDCDI